MYHCVNVRSITFEVYAILCVFIVTGYSTTDTGFVITIRYCSSTVATFAGGPVASASCCNDIRCRFSR